MTLDSTGIIAIIAALALAAVQIITALQNGRKVDALRYTTETNAISLAAKTDTVARDLAQKTEDVAAGLAAKAETVAEGANEKLDVIHKLTNSNLTSLKAELAAANVKIERLEKLVADLAEQRTADWHPPASAGGDETAV